MIKITEIPNLLNNENRRDVSIVFDRDKTVLSYLKESGFAYEGMRIIVSGKKITDLDTRLNKGDQILILPDLKAPLAALAVAAFHLLWAAALAHPFIAAFTVLSIGYGIYSYATAPRSPAINLSGGSGIDSASPTYSWDGIQTTQSVGTPIPIVFGTHRVGGNIINQFINTDGYNNYLNILIALCEGEIEAVSNIEINSNPAVNYQGITTDIRYGTNNDAIVSQFHDLHNIYSINAQLKQNNSFIYTTINNDAEAFEVYLNLSNGLYYQNASDGSINPWEVDYRVEYRLVGSGTWINLGVTAINEQNRSQVQRIFRKDGLTAGKYDIRVTRTSADSDFYHTGDLYLQSVDEIKTEDIAYNNTAKVGIKALATNQLSGSTPNFTFLVKGMKILVPRVMNGSSEVAWDDYYWDPNAFQFRLLSDGTALTWDGTTYVRRYSANPAWCLYELLTNVRFGLGAFIATSQMKIADFLEMSKYCDEKVPDGDGGWEKRFRLDVVIDSASASLDIISQLAAVFNALPFYSQGLIKLKIDKPDSPVQMFGMGNIIENTFQQSCKSLKDIYNVIEVQYLNQDMDYVQDTISVIDEAALAAGDPVRKKTIRLFTTKTSYAVRAGRYALLVAKNINRSILFNAGIDAIALTAGDLFDFAHDVPAWGLSGRIINGTTSSVTLDQSVTLIPSKSYVVRIKFEDDTIQEKPVINAAGTYTVLNVSPSFSKAPMAYDIYAFGEVNKAVKTFRAVTLQRMNNFEVTLHGIEYNENVYDDSAVTVPVNTVSSLDPSIPKVTNLILKEDAVRLNDGTIQDIINVYWQAPVVINSLRKYAKARIFLSADNGASWQLAGESSSTNFSIQNGIAVGNQYKVAVTSVTDHNEQNDVSLSPQASIATVGKNSPPSDVTNFAVDQNNSFLDFSWDPIQDSDLARYIVKKGSTWATGQVVAEKIDATKFNTMVDQIGQVTYLIKAVDTSGNESANPGIYVITVEPPPDLNFVVTLDPWAANREYKLTNIAREEKNLFNPSYARDVFSLTTSQTWEGEQATGKGWDQAVAAGDLNFNNTFQTSGSIEQPDPWDLGFLFEFNVVVDMLFNNVAGGTLIVQIATSEDNVTWTSFANIDGSVNYRARYVKFKYLLTSDGNNNLFFYAGTIFINAPNVLVAWGRDVVVPVAGVTINFGTNFSTTPRITSLVVKNAAGIVEVQSISALGMTIKVKDLTNTYIGTAKVDWEVRGN